MSASPVGEEIKVNLFVIGAQKCGTTALFRLLAQHPQISVSSVKEPSHFVDEQALAAAPQTTTKRWFEPDAYHALFSPVAGAKFYAEATTWYSMAPFTENAAHRIHAYNPDAGFIYMLRNPVERIISHYHMLYRHGFLAMPIREAVDQSPWLMNGSDYASTIDCYRTLFPKESMSVVISERFRADPFLVFAGIQKQLGLDRLEDLDVGTPQDNNVTPEDIRAIRKVDVKALTRWRQTRFWRGARRLAPPAVVRLGQRLLYEPPIDKTDPDLDRVRQDLAPLLADDIARVRELIDDPIPEWD